MNAAPRVTVVTPSYNQSAFIEDTIRSVIEHDYPNIEYIIIDGGSTDGSVDLIRKHEQHLAHWLSEPDEGQADAINKGWRRASGEFVAWLNSDDILLPGSIAAAVDVMQERREVGLVYGDLERLDVAGNHVRIDRYDEYQLVELVSKAHRISQPGSVLRRSTVLEAGYLDPSLHFQMDLDLWIRVALRSQLAHCHRVVAGFRLHDQSKTSRISEVAAADIVTIYDALFQRPDLPESLSRVRRQSWAAAHLYAARTQYGADNLPRAYRALFDALRASPDVMLDPGMLSFAARLLVATALGGRRSRLATQLRRLRRR